MFLRQEGTVERAFENAYRMCSLIECVLLPLCACGKKALWRELLRMRECTPRARRTQEKNKTENKCMPGVQAIGARQENKKMKGKKKEKQCVSGVQPWAPDKN